MNITRKQGLGMAALLALGSIAAAALLSRGPSGMAPPHDGEPEHGSQAPGVVRMSGAQQQAAGIVVAAAAAGQLHTSSEFSGEIRFDEERTAHVVPRVAGIAEAVPAALGQTVRAGQVLAVISSGALSDLRSELLGARRRLEAAAATAARERSLREQRISAEQDDLQAQTALREAEIAVDNAHQKLAAIGASAHASSLNRYEIRAPFDASVVEKHLSRGEAVREDATIFTLSDLRRVWAEFPVAPADLARLRPGLKAVVSSSAFEEQAVGVISDLGQVFGEQTRTARVRVKLDNPRGLWRPGLFVSVRVQGEPVQVATLLPKSAVQTHENRSVVFKLTPEGFVAVPVTTGRSDQGAVELLSGLQPGDRVATVNAFMLKAELGKAGAAHDD